MLIPRYPLEPGVGVFFYFLINLDFNQGQGRFQLIQWCILVVKRISQSKQRIKQSKGSSIFSSSHSSKIEEAMEVTFTTPFSSLHHSRSRKYQRRSLQIKINIAVTVFNIQGSSTSKGAFKRKRRKAPAKSK